MERRELIRKLLTAGHLNVPERTAFRERPLTRSEVAAAIAEALPQTGTFPVGVLPWQPGQNCFEGYFLEQRANGGVRLHWQRHLPLNPRQLAEAMCEDFENTREGIDAYCERELRAGLDGLPIR